MSQDFCLRFFHESSSPKPLKIMLGSFQIFSKILGDIRSQVAPLVSTIPVANCQRCHRHRWQIIGIVSDWLHLKVNLKEKIFLYVNSTTQRCPNKIIKTFLIVDFFHLPLSTTTVVHLELQISPRILKIIKTPVLGYSGAWGKWFMKKTWSQRSRGPIF